MMIPGKPFDKVEITFRIPEGRRTSEQIKNRKEFPWSNLGHL